MSTSAVSTSVARAHELPPFEAEARARASTGEAWLYAGLALAVLAAWVISSLGWYTSGDDLGYWLGVAGGSMMALLFLYPLRKRAAFMQRWGKTKWWFVAHMTLGVMGPWLILLHCAFKVGSLNAAVALYSMCTVVSGVIGRFIYVRIHRGLAGERVSLQALQGAAGTVESEARAWLAFAPQVQDILARFEQRELGAGAPGPLTSLRRVLALPLAQRLALHRCERALREPLAELARTEGWDAETLARRRRRSRKVVQRYLCAVVRVAQYSAYVRLFALWHVAHIPALALLVVSAVVHVIAVHAY
jgi:hypothetical protein